MHNQQVKAEENPIIPAGKVTKDSTSDAAPTMKIKGGYGYYETDFYPIGGSFHRAPAEGLEILLILRRFDRYQGCNIEVRLANGKRAALNSDHIDHN